jgi:molecular chaperone GrpE
MMRRAFTNSVRALPLRAASPMVRQSIIRQNTPRAFQPAMSRWYSDAKETPAEGAKAEEAEAKKSGESDALAELNKKLEAKDAEARDWKDKCLRSVADFRNLQDRTQREVKTARDFAIQRFAKDLIESVDVFDHALASVPAEKLNAPEKTEHLQDLANLHEGLKMTEAQLIKTLAKHGLERVNPEGEKFNPNEHEATFMAPMPDKEDGTVLMVQQKGFKLNGRTLRAAKVGVVKNK